MKHNRKWRRPAGVVLSLCLILGLTACGGKQADLPDLSAMGTITAVAREEGSGTRAEFERLTGSTGGGTDQIALSTEEVLEQVMADENAIGYLALSSAAGSDIVKVLAVDGVVPEEDTVKSGKYPLCRNYYMAYMGELNGVETDFMAYLLSAGQELVAQSCVPVKTASTFLSDGCSGTITICGSSSVAPLMKQLAEDYQTYNPNAVVIVEESDSAAGLTAAIRGESDFAMSSRALKDYESELLESKVIASDGMAVVVNSTNPLESLTLKQLKQIYDGTLSQWTDLK